MEFVIAAPILFGLILLVVHAGVWAHAGHCAQAAADRAAETARAFDSTVEAGTQAGYDTLDDIAPASIADPVVTVVRTDTEVTATVTGTATAVIPGWAWTVTATVTMPVERFVPDIGDDDVVPGP